MFKEPRSGRVERKLRRLKAKAAEDEIKKAVRKRDKVCRFPLCGCKRFGLALHVSHAGGPDSHHKGMGGNPKGDRSNTATMILLCAARHRENKISIDRGMLKWHPLTDRGADGPVSWWVRSECVHPALAVASEWFYLASEDRFRRVRFDDLFPGQRLVLAELSGMLD